MGCQASLVSHFARKQAVSIGSDEPLIYGRMKMSRSAMSASNSKMRWQATLAAPCTRTHTLQWISDKEELGFRFQAVPYEDISKIKKLFDVDSGKNLVDFAIVSEEGVFGVRKKLLNAQTSGPLLDFLRSQDKYIENGKISDPKGLAYVVFKRDVAK